MRIRKKAVSVLVLIISLLLPMVVLADIKATTCSQNQTDRRSLEIVATDKSTIGTLIVIMSAPESVKKEDNNSNRVIALKELTYAQALEIGNKAFVFKWVANSIASLEKINALRQASDDGKEVGSCEPCSNGYCSNCCSVGHPCVCSGGANFCTCECW